MPIIIIFISFLLFYSHPMKCIFHFMPPHVEISTSITCFHLHCSPFPVIYNRGLPQNWLHDVTDFLSDNSRAEPEFAGPPGGEPAADTSLSSLFAQIQTPLVPPPSPGRPAPAWAQGRPSALHLGHKELPRTGQCRHGLTKSQYPGRNWLAVCKRHLLCAITLKVTALAFLWP